MTDLRFQLIHANARVPARATAGSAGYDIVAVEDECIPAGCQMTIRTGLRLHLPVNTYGKLEPRSSMVMERVLVLAGVIDQDYRGEIKIVIANHGSTDWNIEIGDRCAQLIIHQIVHPTFTQAFSLDETQRSHGGFGSTGGRKSLYKQWKI